MSRRAPPLEDNIVALMIEHELLAKEIAEVKLAILDIYRGGLEGNRLHAFQRGIETLEFLREEQRRVSYSEIAEKFEMSRTTLANLFQRDRW